ncbi:MAG: rhomboid family serine protease [Labilithrix sp.]|nr:rhomboid family serine protease [Labilithrix sp.]
MNEPTPEHAPAPPPPPPPEEPTLIERARAAPITFLITAVNIAVFVWAEYYGGGTASVATLLRFGALEPYHVWAGEPWRLVTCMFLHIGILHIGVNTYMSIGWSTSLERVLGKGRFLFLYLVSGVFGSLFSVIAGFLFEPHVSAGASGALFGVVGATLAIRRRQLPDAAAFFRDRGVRSTLVQFGLLTVAGSYLHFDNSAHLGGLLGGAAIMLIFTSRAARGPRWAALAVVGFALLVYAARPWWTPPPDGQMRVAQFASAWLTGKLPGGEEPWPADVPRGVRLAEKGCATGGALSCGLLAEHYDQADDRARAAPLRERACTLEPALCAGLHVPQ